MHYEERNRSIKAQLAAWQVAWHDEFDRCPGVHASSARDRPDPLPDLGTDFRLIWGLRSTFVDTRSRCFGMFPEGAEMHRRFEEGFSEHFSLSGPPIYKAEAMHLYGELRELVNAASPAREVAWKLEPVNTATTEGLDTIRMTESLKWIFEKKLPSDPRPLLPGIAARSFLSEPLIAMAGNTLEARDWITGATLDPEEDEVFAALYQLRKSGWSVRVGESVTLFGSWDS